MEGPAELVEELARGNGVLFIDAGLSMAAGLPGWANLLAPLADEIKLPPNKRGDLLKVAQYSVNSLGRQRVVQHILDATDTTGVDPTANHRKLLGLGAETWVTTNYDDLLEQTLAEAGVRHTAVVQDTDLAFTTADAFTLLKLHGDRRQPDSIVIAQGDYNTLSLRRPVFRKKLDTLLAEKTLLFVGYSLGDPDMSLALAEIGFHLSQLQRTAYAVLFDVDEFTRDDLLRQHIRVANLDTGG